MAIFKKIFSHFLVFFLFLTVNVYSEVVKKVEIKGNERISNETIIVFGDISVGKDYSNADVNSLIKKLYSTSFFSDISVTLKNNTLNIVVRENPIIKSILLFGLIKFQHVIKHLSLLHRHFIKLCILISRPHFFYKQP